MKRTPYMRRKILHDYSHRVPQEREFWIDADLIEAFFRKWIPRLVLLFLFYAAMRII